jgi:catechol 2,3-dioxygenase-like lactoylglutathione lyase family enzyme
MKILGLNWIGTRTNRFEETVTFFEQVLGLPVGHRRKDFARLDLPDASCVEVFAEAESDHRHFTTGPVVGFLVEDLSAARNEFVRHEIQLLGPVGGEVGDYRWQHFRGPDGCVYELVESPARPPPGPPTEPVGITHIAWVGTRTARYAETCAFFADLLHLPILEARPDLVEYAIPGEASVEVFRASGGTDPALFPNGPVPGFGVRDFPRALGALQARHVEVFHAAPGDRGGWAHFRAPDGCVYEVEGPRGPARRSGD